MIRSRPYSRSSVHMRGLLVQHHELHSTGPVAEDPFAVRVIRTPAVGVSDDGTTL